MYVRTDGHAGDPNTIDRDLYRNTKLSVQVVAPKLQERRLVRAMQLVDDVLRGRVSRIAKL
jgi:stress-induced morphogen